MKRILTFFLALTMVLSLAACGGKTDDNKGKTEVTMTAQEIMDTLKEKLGDSFGCDVAETEDNISGYWGLDMEQVESWASMSNSNSAVNSSYAVIVKVKDGYAQDAAALLQTGYEQILSYSRMYNMDLQKVLQARLFVNGNYVALLILGAQGDWEASDEVQAKFAAEEAAKVDAVWSGIFGSAENTIVIPEDSGENGGLFDMSGDESELMLPENSDEPQNEETQDSNKSDKKDTSNQPDTTKKDDSEKVPADKKDEQKKDTAKEQTAGEVLDSMKIALGASYTSGSTESEDRISGYYGLDLSKVESWAAESSSMSSTSMDCAVVLKVKDGYAKDAAAALQTSYEQVLSYARMYNMDLQRVLQGRLYISGNYVAYFIEGQAPDHNASAEAQAKFAAGEAAKVDAAWSALFGSASNSIVIPEESGSDFDMTEGMVG